MISFLSTIFPHIPSAQHHHRPQKHICTPFTVVHSTSKVTVEKKKVFPTMSTAVNYSFLKLTHFAPLIFMIGFALHFLYEGLGVQSYDGSRKSFERSISCSHKFSNGSFFLTLHIMIDITCQSCI